MLYIDSDGNYPKYKGDLQELLGDWDYDQPLPEGWILVEVLEKPEDLPGKELILNPELEWINEKPYQGWLYIDSIV